MDILQEIALRTKERISQQKNIVSPDEIIEKAEKMVEADVGKATYDLPFEKALKSEGLSLICEVKKASPSKGVIAEYFPYLDIAKAYEKGGANAISCLTEPFYFQGSNSYLKEITDAVKIPVLRKDFTVDPYMIYEAKTLGASAVLLIASILNDEELESFFELAEKLKLSAIFEAHDEEEIKRCLNAGARIVGVNNRNLRDFSVDIKNSKRFEDLIPKDVIYISESGVKGVDDLVSLKGGRADAVLVGEALMRSKNPEETLKDWKQMV